MGTIKAIIFDLDGTLVDSAPHILIAVDKLLVQEGRRRPLRFERVSAMIGDDAPKLVERAMNATGEGDAPKDLPTLTRRFLGFYEGHTADLTRPYPGVPEVLECLRSAGVRMGICTNKPERPTREIAARPAAGVLFPGRVRRRYGGGLQEARSTADPCLLDALGTEAAEAVMVGDNANDIVAARAAGNSGDLAFRGYTRVPAESLISLGDAWPLGRWTLRGAEFPGPTQRRAITASERLQSS